MKNFKVTISSGYHKVTNTTLTVNAKNKDEAQEKAYEFMDENPQAVNWKLCESDFDDILVQTENIEEVK